MLYYLSQYLQDVLRDSVWADTFSWLRVFRYITVRAGGAALTALALSWVLGPPMIAWLRRLSFGQAYADRAVVEGRLAGHVADKRGVPMMGGLLILMLLSISTVLWARMNALVGLTLLVTVVLGTLGFCDDFRKVTKQDSAGVPAWMKLVVQFGVALFVGLYLAVTPGLARLVADINVPSVKYPVLYGVPLLGVLIAVLAIVGSSNAVNFTDGLDGLAIGCTVIVGFVFLVMTYVTGHSVIASYLQIPYVAGAGELTVFCAALIGAGLGFLWYNCHPAQVFMGDTGSLAIGGALGVISVLIHQPFILLIAGGVFVLEAVSVLVQVSWFKLTRRWYGEGRRVFLMAPLHYHYLKKGWTETQVVTRFYIWGIIFGVLALSTLKIR